MRFTIITEHDSTSQVLHESLKKLRIADSVEICTCDTAIDHLIANQPCIVLIGLKDERSPRCLRLVKEIKEIAFGKIIVVGPAVEAKALLMFLQEGIYEYIDVADFESAITNAVNRLGKEQPNGFHRATVTSVISAGGGCGASTLAVNLAIALQKNNKKIILMDLNLESGDLCSHLNVRSVHSVSDLCRSIARLDESMLQKSLGKHASGVHLMAAPIAIDEVEHVTPRSLRRLLHVLETRFDEVIIDLGRVFRAQDLMVLQQSNHIVLTLRPDISSLRNARRTLDYLDHCNVDLGKIKPVVNRYRTGAGVSLASIRDTLGMEIAQVIPEDVRRVNAAVNSGVPMLIKKPRSTFSRRINEFVTESNLGTQTLAV
jgi:pilus assembly protein CpaE